MPDEPDRLFDFTLAISMARKLTPALTDALYAAGCDDCTPRSVGPNIYLDFHRKAPSLAEAIVSAIKDVERAGFGAELTAFGKSTPA